MVKITHRGSITVAPGKMAEAMKLLKKMIATNGQNWRCYKPLIGGGDVVHTVICESEYDSLNDVVVIWEEDLEDPEMKETQEKWESVITNHEAEWFTPIPL
jgi:hypothetical protein